MEDLYELLGVERSASQQEIKSAYRRLAKRYHPDVNNGDEDSQEHFKKINIAYEVLGDEEKRSQYDRYGDAVFQNGGAGAGGGFGGFGGMGDIFGDIFGDLFGQGFGARGAARRNAPQVGGDIRVDITLPFREAVFGSEREVSFTRVVHCEVCEGSGSAEEGGKKTCPTCHGSGHVQFVQQSPFGQFVRQEVCDTCRGTGEVIENPCEHCHGEGMERKRRKLKIRVPKGVDNGDVLPLRGEGHHGKNGGPPGDLYVVFHVEPHELFERNGLDLHFEMPITFSQAALGGELEIPTLTGTEPFSLDEGTQTGHTYRLKHKGIENAQGRTGDLFFTVRVETPTKLSDEQKKLLEEFAKAGGEDVHAKKKGLFEKVKDLFD